MMGLTQAQNDMLEFLRERLAATGIAPTYAEMRVRLGYNSNSPIHQILTSLEARGAIRRMFRRPRAIEIIAPKPSCCPNCGHSLERAA
jgi:repressor LexA